MNCQYFFFRFQTFFYRKKPRVDGVLLYDAPKGTVRMYRLINIVTWGQIFLATSFLGLKFVEYAVAASALSVLGYLGTNVCVFFFVCLFKR